MCLYYNYKIDEVKKLTPKQAYYMAEAIQKKINDEVRVMASIFGAKIEGEETETKEDFNYKKVDTSFIDSINDSKFDELMQNA